MMSLGSLQQRNGLTRWIVRPHKVASLENHKEYEYIGGDNAKVSGDSEAGVPGPLAEADLPEGFKNERKSAES